jgi:DNA-binding CsgD family transcriptional regulator
MSGTARREPASLLGRASERALLMGLLDDVAARGQALVVHGEPGIGKSRLLDDAARAATERGMTVLSTAGVQSEARLPFAGLHQLLRPVRARAAALPEVQRAALDAAFGLSHAGAAEPFRIAMAALDLVAEVATDAPVLLVAEDAQWLDRPTADVLAFLARRIESDPIILLAATRDGYPSALQDSGIAELPLAGLDDADAAALLDEAAPELSLVARTQVLAVAAGNPLALCELPKAASEDSGGALTERLERAFAGRVAELPEPARVVLLVAALNDGDDLTETLAGASALAGTELDADALAPAVAAGIVTADLRTLRFRHPLMRSAVAQHAGVAARRRAHEALAAVLRDHPDRRAWHRAALLTGTHEDVAGELEDAAARARRRGAVATAVSALRRAAELGQPQMRDRRLLAAAALAVEMGRPDLVERLLAGVDRGRLDDLDGARATWVEETALTRPLGGTERFTGLIAAAERAGAAGDRDLHVDLLWLVASRAWWADPGPDARAALIAAAGRLGGADAPDPRVFAVHAYADPWGHAAGVLDRLDAATAAPGAVGLDADAVRFYGPAALVVGAFDLGIDLLGAAVEGLRTQGRLGHLPRLLTLYASMAARLGEWDTALTAADEARRLADELGEPQWSAAADTASAMVLAMRGDEEQALRLCAGAELVAGPVGANITMAFAQFGKVLAGLAIGRHGEAYNNAERLFTPGDAAYHPVICSWLVADLADAARHTGDVAQARARVDEVAARAGERPGSWIALTLRHARALLAEPEDAEACFDAALSCALTRWPFQRARIQLAQGQWLRRHRRVAESRVALRAARDTFDALGCKTWGEHARRELRAAGERSRHRVPEARDQLTAQELQIAQLAAQGLSNREIGARLFLSHRTISTHLYRVFPKLGITSRGELAAALAPSTVI